MLVHKEIDCRQLRLTSKLGAGQFGEVLKGKWKGTLPVAVKIFAADKITVPTLVQETSLMKKLNHPNLVHIYDVCTNEGEPIYFVTELLKESLLQYLRGDGKTMVLHQLVDIAVQVATGMAYLEQASYIHQNLAARNILVGGNGLFKVADFGLIRGITESIVAIRWTAPEIVLQNLHGFSIKSDVWSFGILLHEIVTFGKLPYLGMNNAQVLEAVPKGYRMPCPPDCPKELHGMMLACWNEDPNSRLTFETLQWQLEEFFTLVEGDGYITP